MLNFFLKLRQSLWPGYFFMGLFATRWNLAARGGLEPVDYFHTVLATGFFRFVIFLMIIPPIKVEIIVKNKIIR